MPLEDADLLTGLRVPDPDRLLLTPRDQAAAVRAECRVDPSLEVPGEGLEALAVAPVPDVDLPSAPRGEAPAVRAERDAMRQTDRVVGPGQAKTLFPSSSPRPSPASPVVPPAAAR